MTVYGVELIQEKFDMKEKKIIAYFKDLYKGNEDGN